MNDDVEAAATQLRQMPENEFKERFSSLYQSLSRYNRETDTIVLMLILDEDGISDWQFIHLDLSKKADIFAGGQHHRYFKSPTEEQEEGIGVLSIGFVSETTPQRDEIRPALYSLLSRLADGPDIAPLLNDRDAVVEIASTDDGFSFQIRKNCCVE